MILDFDFSIKIPLGWTKKPYYYIEYMAEGTGWQKRTLVLRVRRIRKPVKGCYSERPEYYPVSWTRAIIQTQTKHTRMEGLK